MIKELLPAQYDFVFSDEKFPAMVGGLGSGKSEAGIMRTLRLMFENQGANILYAMPTYDLLRLRAIPGFEEFLTNAQIPYSLNKSESIIQIEGYGKIIFRSYDNPKRIIAFEVFGAIVDELDTLKKEEATFVWRKISERVRQNIDGKLNSIGCVTTPDMGYNGFIYHNWFKLQREGYVVIKASTYDNPFLPKDYIQNILDNYDPILADLYLRGEIVSLNQNKIYHFFDRGKHHNDRVLEKEDQFIHVCIDFNIGGCCSSVWVIDGNKPIAVDEFVSHDTYDFVNTLSAKFPDKTITVYPDASGKAERTNASKTDIQIIEDAGFNVDAPSANPAVRDRINSVNALFAHGKIGVNTNKCPNLTNAIEIQGYDDNGQPEKWNTHPAVDDWTDGMGYFINRRWGLIRPVVGVSTFAMR